MCSIWYLPWWKYIRIV